MMNEMTEGVRMETKNSLWAFPPIPAEKSGCGEPAPETEEWLVRQEHQEMCYSGSVLEREWAIGCVR